MADDVTVDNGGLTDYDVATDDDGAGNHVQIVKLAQAADASRTPISADADGLLVNLGANNDVTLAEPISVDDNAGSLTVDNPALSVVGGGVEASAQRVTIANDSTGVVSVDDNGGSLTVDGTVAVTATDLDIRNLDVGQDDVRVGGMAANDAAVADNPLASGARASTALPTAVSADGDAVWQWANRHGAVVIAAPPHVGLNSDPYNLLHEAAQYTTSQTSTALITGGASEKIVVTKVQIQVGGTTAGTLQLYFAAAAAFSRGTTRAIFDGEFAPSATLKPGVIMDGPFISGTNGDDLLVTTSAAINPLTINVWYYIVT